MTVPPVLRIVELQRFEWRFVLRLPFRFGVITLTEGRQAALRLRIELPDGRTAWGMAAEVLSAKWFDKNPALTDAQNFHQLRRALELAEQAYLAHGPGAAYAHAADSYAPLLAQGAAERLPPLVTNFGPALFDRAVADALGRALGLSFFDLARGNLLGIAPAALAPDLAGFDAARFLAALSPLPALQARHTVGLVDPIVAADQPMRVNDGLPETLEEVVAFYGQRWFKLKAGGDVAADIDRLSRIAAVLDRIDGPYHATLDGNEQYADAPAALALVRAMQAAPALRRLCRSLLFIEQPIRRADALARDVSALDEFAPVILDESDATIDAFPQGRALGYRGISSKTCKGFYKSLLNAMRCAQWNAEVGRRRYFMSGEDLTTLAGIAVQQDSALAALLGLAHVERNGHHFVDGFAGRPEAEAREFLRAHPDLYHAAHGRIRLRITAGRFSTASLRTPGFGSAAHPDTAAMEPMPRAAWPTG